MSVLHRFAFGLSVSIAMFASPSNGQDDHASSPYVRVEDADDGDRTLLKISSRVLRKKDGTGPEVHLVGVVHIGDGAYYRELQTYLDSLDLVLFEGVKPGGMGDAGADAPADDAAKIKLTQSRIRMLAMYFERAKSSGGDYPASIDALIASMKGTPARLLGAARTDAWGREILLERSNTRILEGERELWAGEEFDFISRGEDGREGGSDAAADLRFSDQKPLTKRERTSGSEGIQPKLARALGLEFQLAAMDYTRDRWRNSDMTIDQVQARMKEEGVDPGALFAMLDGGGIGGKVIGMMLGFIERDPAMSTMVKTMMVETLANADAMMEQQPGDMGKMMKVIVVDRNEVVLDDLKKVLENETQLKSVALFYGAGHLPHLEQRLTEDFGFEFVSDRWFTAIDVDLAKIPGAKAQSKRMREMVRGMSKQKKD